MFNHNYINHILTIVGNKRKVILASHKEAPAVTAWGWHLASCEQKPLGLCSYGPSFTSYKH
jgi:hypothetical protein